MCWDAGKRHTYNANDGDQDDEKVEDTCPRRPKLVHAVAEHVEQDLQSEEDRKGHFKIVQRLRRFSSLLRYDL